MKRTLAALFSTAVVGFFLTGCAIPRLVESDVTAFYKWNGAPPVPGTLYRFERLPSQQAVGAQQDQLEGVARNALARVGMTLNSSAARFSVQVQLNTLLTERGPYGDAGFGNFGWVAPGLFLGGGNHGASVGLSLPIHFSEPAAYRHELTLLMRDLASSQTVFETHAVSDSIHNDTLTILPALLDAALRGFPQPPPGTHRLSVDIARQNAGAP